MNEARAALAIARKELRTLRRYPLQSINTVAQPLYQFLIPSVLLGSTFLVAGRAVGFQASAGTADVSGFLFLGAFVGGQVGAAFWGSAFAFRLEMMSGTLEPAWLTPTRRETFVVGYLLASLVVQVLGGAVLLGIGAVFFSARFFGAALAALPALLLVEVGLVGVSYLVASGVLLMKEANFFVDSTNFLFNAASGTMFPIAVMPGLVKAIAFLLPTTYALDILRAQALSTPLVLPGWSEYLALAGLGLLAVLAGRWTFARAERRLRRSGSLGQY